MMMMRKHAAIALIWMGTAAALFAEGWIDQPETFWRDSTFQKAFMGSYGMRAEIEPRVTVVERDLMEEIMNLLGEADGAPQAIALIRKHLKPASSAIFDFTLANIHFQEDRLSEAAAAYEAAIEKFPSFQRAHRNLALVRVRQGEFEAALHPLTRSIELGANDGLTYGLLGYAYTMTEQQVAAESAYRMAMMLQPHVLDWKLGLCRALFRQQKYAEAIALCAELLRQDPGRADFLLLQANAYLGLRQPMRAAEIYELLDLSGQTPVAALHTLGDIYVNEGHFGQAADAYARALARDPAPDLSRQIRNVEALVARAAYEDAATLLGAVATRMDDQAPVDQRARLLKIQARLAAARQESDTEQARLLAEIVKLDPLDGEALILLGQHYAPTDLERAIFYFERAQGIERFEADARLRHAQALVRNSRFQEALPLLRRSLELRPREDVQRYAEQVERIARRG